MSEETDDFSMDDLGETLGEAFDAATDEGPARDESGKFTSKEAPAEAADDVSFEDDMDLDDESTADDLDNEGEGDPDDLELDDDGDATSDTVEAPDSWTAEARERFANLDPDTQAYIVQREQEQAEGVSKLKEQFESKAALADEFTEIVRPYEAQMRAEGATPQQAVQTLLNTAQILRTGTPQQKEAIIRQTAQQFGVNLSSEPGESYDGPADSNVAALQKQVADLTNFIIQQQHQTVEQQQRGVLSEIEQFSEAKNDKGEPLRPHYSAVESDMIPLIASIRSSNPGKSNAEVLTEAYDRAVWANPETRKLVQQASTKEAEAKRLQEAKKAATEAKRSKNVRTKGSRPGGQPKPSAKPSDWEDDLSEAYDRAS